MAVEGVGVEAEADWDHLRTPETYLGYGRSEHFASPDGPGFDEQRAYELPEHLRLNRWALAGEWTIGRETVVLDRAGGRHRVPVPRARRAPGAVAPEGGGRSPSGCSSTARPRAPRTARTSTRTGTACSRTAACTSSCASGTTVRERTLEITFLEPGAEAYSFTFG